MCLLDLHKYKMLKRIRKAILERNTIYYMLYVMYVYYKTKIRDREKK